MKLRHLIDAYKISPSFDARAYEELRSKLAELYSILNYKTIRDLELDSIVHNAELLAYAVVMSSEDTQCVVRFHIADYIADAPDSECAAALWAMQEQQRLISSHLDNASVASAALKSNLQRVLGPQPLVQCEQKSITDAQLKDMWREAGGRFYGPNVETGSMPEEQLLPFLRKLCYMLR